MRARWIAEKRAEIATLADLRLTELTPSRRDFTQFIAVHKQGMALVPRVQRRSPATGGAWPHLDVLAFAHACDESEAAAIAVSTAALFGGTVDDLDAVAGAVSAPVLRDDLCLHHQQVYQSRLRGADAVRFPTAELEPAALRELVAVASSLHMTSIVEVGDAHMLPVALALPTVCIGVTAGEGRADSRAVRSLAEQIPRQRTVVLLDEVAVLDDLLALVGVVDAAVVGDALLGDPDPAAAIAAFLARVG
jgi:indole-3-glycerol phosphate synthase